MLVQTTSVWPPCCWLTLCWAPTPEPVHPAHSQREIPPTASSSSSCLFPQCSSLYTQQPRCSHQPFYTFPLLLASFHRSLLSASTQRFVQRTKLLSLPVWLSSASALVLTPEHIMYTGCFWWCHSCMDTCDESNGFWWTITALDTATNSLTQTQSSSSKPGLSLFSFGQTKTGWVSDTSSDALLWKDTCGPKAHCSKY